MIFRESAPVAPLLAYALVVAAGADDPNVKIGFLLCEAAGVVVYIAELRYRFRTRNGRR